MEKTSLKKTPRLLAHLMAGRIFFEGDEEGGYYFGHAKDGSEVHMGSDGQETQIESYLAAHPSPAEW